MIVSHNNIRYFNYSTRLQFYTQHILIQKNLNKFKTVIVFSFMKSALINIEISLSEGWKT